MSNTLALGVAIEPEDQMIAGRRQCMQMFDYPELLGGAWPPERQRTLWSRHFGTWYQVRIRLERPGKTRDRPRSSQ
jgi:hypothetical protein